MLTKKIATVVATVGALAAATPASARPTHDSEIRSSEPTTPTLRIIEEPCSSLLCGANHNRRMIRQR